MANENIRPELKETEKAVEEARDSTKTTDDLGKTGYITVGEIRASKEYLREAEMIREVIAKAKPQVGDKTTVDQGFLDPISVVAELYMATASADIGVEPNEFEGLSAKTAEVLQKAALAHERMAKDQEEIEQLKTETRAMLVRLRAA